MQENGKLRRDCFKQFIVFFELQIFLPQEYLSQIYDEIAGHEIKMKGGSSKPGKQGEICISGYIPPQPLFFFTRMY